MNFREATIRSRLAPWRRCCTSGDPARNRHRNRKRENSIANALQCDYLNQQVILFQKRRQPTISVDTKKTYWREISTTAAEPKKVRVHNFKDKDLGKAIPYGVYNIINYEGWVSVGFDRDAALFDSRSIHRGCEEMAAASFPEAGQHLITADRGGSNSHRCHLWKVESTIG